MNEEAIEIATGGVIRLARVILSDAAHRAAWLLHAHHGWTADCVLDEVAAVWVEWFARTEVHVIRCHIHADVGVE